MSLSKSDRREVWGDHNFLVPVIHCLEGEQNTGPLWHWLEVDARLGPRNPLSRLTSPVWKQTVFRRLVEAQVHWSDDSNFIDNSIATVIKAYDMRKSMPIRSATLFLMKVMKKAPTQNEDLHDRFAEIVQKIYTLEDEGGWFVAELRLYHPTRPDASPLMQILRSDEAHVQRWFEPQTYSAGLNVIFTICALARRCIADGKKTDARWVLDHAYDKAPYLFSGGSALQSFRDRVRDAIPTTPTYKPSKKELARGVEVDKDGNVTHSELMKAGWLKKYTMERGPR